jgi:hypothetical protein
MRKFDRFLPAAYIRRRPLLLGGLSLFLVSSMLACSGGTAVPSGSVGLAPLSATVCVPQSSQQQTVTLPQVGAVSGTLSLGVLTAQGTTECQTFTVSAAPTADGTSTDRRRQASGLGTPAYTISYTPMPPAAAINIEVMGATINFGVSAPNGTYTVVLIQPGVPPQSIDISAQNGTLTYVGPTMAVVLVKPGQAVTLQFYRTSPAPPTATPSPSPSAPSTTYPSSTPYPSSPPRMTPTPSPPPTPSPTATAPVIVASPNFINFPFGSAEYCPELVHQNFTVSEAGYTGTFNAVSSMPADFTVTPSISQGSFTANYTANSFIGSVEHIAISDNMGNTLSLPVEFATSCYN